MEQYNFGPAGAQIPDATGATAQSGGARGLVPAPSSGDQDKFLKGDGTWSEVPATVIYTTQENQRIATISDGADGMPIKRLVVGIEPVQTGSGDPAPDNVRPVSGWTGCNVWDDPAYGGLVNWNQHTKNGNFADGTNNWVASSNAISMSAQDGILTVTVATSVGQWTNVSGTGVADTSAGRKLLVTAVGRGDRGNPNPGVVNATPLAAVTETEGSWIRVTKILNTAQGNHPVQVYFSSYGSYVSGDKMQLKSVNVFDLTKMFGATVADQIYAMEQATAGSGVAWFRNLFPADFYAYDSGTEKTVSEVNGNPYRHIEVTFPTPPGTVYGGTLEVYEDGTGKLTVDRVGFTLDEITEFYGTTSQGSYKYTRPVIDSSLLLKTNSITTQSEAVKSVNQSATKSAYSCYVNKPSNGTESIYVICDTDTTVEYYNANIAGSKIIAQLKTPVEYTLTSAQVGQIKTLLGTNNFWADTGDIVNIEYPTDMKMYVDRKLDKNQGSANVGKVMRVNSSGELEPDDEQDISGKVDIAQGSSNSGKILRVGNDGNLALDDSMVILSYGSSTWNDFITAYNSNSVVYCRASSNSDPSSGSQTRLAFMAYVNNTASPTEVEFQYYRSVSSHSASQQGDQVFVYKLVSSGTWTVTTREAMSKIATGTNMSSSYSNGTLTLSATDTTYSDFSGSTHGLVPAASSGDSGKFLKGDGTWTDVPAPSVMTGATSSTAGTSGLAPAPASGYQNKVLKGDGTWGDIDALPAVTASDNGKFLRVVNGSWSVATVPSASGVSF